MSLNRSAATRIKLSGVTQPDDARLAADLGIDLVACVFYARSPRYVTLPAAWEIRRALSTHVQMVGIFVDAPLPLVQHVVSHCALDHAQLFGNEPRAEVEALRPHAFKALTIDHPDNAERLVRAHIGQRPTRSEAPALLANLRRTAREAWSCVAGAATRAPLLLASGALSPATAQTAIATVRPWGVDVWDVVELSPGRIDPKRLEAFVAAVREADRALAGVESGY